MNNGDDDPEDGMNDDGNGDGDEDDANNGGEDDNDKNDDRSETGGNFIVNMHGLPYTITYEEIADFLEGMYGLTKKMLEMPFLV